jgi:hypothetical protein
MLRLYTDESPGLKVDPVVVLVLSLVFIFSVVALHSKFALCVFDLGLGACGLWNRKWGKVEVSRLLMPLQSLLRLLDDSLARQWSRSGNGEGKVGGLVGGCSSQRQWMWWEMKSDGNPLWTRRLARGALELKP